MCCRAKGRKVKRADPLVQLALELELAETIAEDWIEPADLPAMSSKMDWREVVSLRRWASLREPLPIDVDDEI